MIKKILLISIIAILCLATSYLLKSNMDMRKALIYKDEETKNSIENERLKIRKDLKQKHRADMVSYKAMMKRLEAEKKKSREMQKSINELTGQNGG